MPQALPAPEEKRWSAAQTWTAVSVLVVIAALLDAYNMDKAKR